MNKKDLSCSFQDEWLSDERLRIGLVKQGIRKRLVVLYAKGILIFLQWEEAQRTHV